MRSRLGSGVTGQEDRQIRLALVIHSMMRGGAERQIFELLRGIDRSRFNPTLVVLNSHPNAYPVEGFIDCKTLLERDPARGSPGRRIASLLVASYRLTEALRECGAEVVHAFLPLPSALTALACALLRVPVFVVGRRNMVSSHRRGKRTLELADRLPVRFATAIVGNCKAITHEMVKADHFPEERAFTIYNGIDTERFAPRRNCQLRSELGFAPSDFVFGIVANFHARKRHIDFVRAAREICIRFSHAKFLMIGEDQGALREIEVYLQTHFLAKRCVIVAGTTEPEKYYACMDCYISASEVEGLSNAILEAMASGLPIIATDVGGSAEMVEEGESGFLVAPYAPGEIAEKAGLLIENRSLCTLMGRRGRTVAENMFSLAKMVEAHERLYAALLFDRVCTS